MSLSGKVVIGIALFSLLSVIGIGIGVGLHIKSINEQREIENQV